MLTAGRFLRRRRRRSSGGNGDRSKMVLVSAVRDYVNRMLQDISGMKVLVLDSQTVSSSSTRSLLAGNLTISPLRFARCLLDRCCLLPHCLIEQLGRDAMLMEFAFLCCGDYCDSQVSVVSVVYSQSELLKKEVFLVEMVDSISKSRESMSHLKAVCFLRPTLENVHHLRRQLASPRFGEYHLCEFL